MIEKNKTNDRQVLIKVEHLVKHFPIKISRKNKKAAETPRLLAPSFCRLGLISIRWCTQNRTLPAMLLPCLHCPQ